MASFKIGLFKRAFKWSIHPRAWISTTCARGELYKSVPEQPVPIEGQVKGSLPSWLNGRLIRNGPGLFEIGDTKLNHWFDGMALLHSFTIQSGKVTYTSKFLRSDSYTKNMAANRLVVSEFGTHAVPDPCQTLFQRFKSYFTALTDPTKDMTDNCTVNVFPAGDKLIATTETDFVHVFSPDTLDSTQRVQLSKHVAVNTATAHPHIDSDGTVYNLGNCTTGYAIIKIPPTEKGAHVMDKASVLCTVPAKNKLRPGYSHSFAASENYFVFLEQPLRLNIAEFLRSKLLNRPVVAENALVYDDEMIRFYVVEKSSGHVLPGKFFAPPAVILHHINAYEDNGQIVLDACAYDNWQVYLGLDLKAMNAQVTDRKVSQDLVFEPRRYVLPIDPLLLDPSKENLVTLDYTTATAKLQEDGSVVCHPEVISEIDFEFPRINYEEFNGKRYQFVYGIDENFNSLVKTDVTTKKCLTWSEDGCFPSEPVFVRNPAGTKEDDGVILSAVLQLDESRPPFLLALDATTMSEIGRVEFPGIQWHKDIHGIFVPTAGQ